MESDDDSSSFNSSNFSTDTESGSTYSPSDDIVDEHEIFRCDLCNKIFNHASTLRRHQKDHEASKCRGLNNEEYICHLCNKLYYFVRHYNAHMLERHNIRIDVSSTNSPKPNSHNHGSEENIPDESISKIKRIDETRSLFDCKHCDRQFCSKQGVTRHLKTHLVDSYRCKVCRKHFSSQNALSRHENNEKKKQLLKKPRSKKPLPKKRILSTNTGEQELSHKFMNEKQVSSEKPSSRKEQLSPTAVMNADTEKPVNACIPSNECASSIDQVLPNEQSLPDNVVPTKQLVSEEAVSPEEVQIIDQISDLNSSVLENNQDQSSSTETIDLNPGEMTDTKNFSCTICDRNFFTENTLQLHLATHRKLPQMHYCSLCDYCSECQFAFALHALDHYKKKFKCNGCSRSFYTKNTMELHAETHLSS